MIVKYEKQPNGPKIFYEMIHKKEIYKNKFI